MIPDIERFRREHGAEWYLFVSSPMFQAAKLAMVLAGPSVNTTGISAADITANGVAIAANIQGYNEALRVLEFELVVPPEMPEGFSDPGDYLEEIQLPDLPISNPPKN